MHGYAIRSVAAPLDADTIAHSAGQGTSTSEAVAAFEASGAKRLLLTHRPKELALDGGLEQAHDGLELDV